MSRFFVPKDSVKGNLIHVSGDEMHHIIDVMRLKTRDKVVTFDGAGNEYIGVIEDVKARSAIIRIIDTKIISADKTSAITLIQAIPKKEKMDYIVEKSTEMGVSAIIPVVTERTIPVWDGPKRAAAAERWRKIAKEASKQCGRRDIPVIEEVKSFTDISANASAYGLALIAALDDRAVRLKDAIKDCGGSKIAIAIGPEGDFTPDEITKAVKGGFRLVSLGSHVLKSDTAGLFVIAALNYEFNS
ncbi:MAG: 16S rRNA (uracil(1498)-N(3))-methyltransferase [Candidatus Omnitrophica bacterium]|nr:16S rRNA (uracil(1498)-N(3))-methyltransferase [Candidatus Omnitrophota bacterium]